MRKLFEKAKTSFSSILYRNDKPSHRFNELSFLSKASNSFSPFIKEKCFDRKLFWEHDYAKQRRGMYISEDIETRIFISFAYLHKIISCNLIFINIYSKKHSISRLLLPSDNKNSKYSIDILLNLKLFTF